MTFFEIILKMLKRNPGQYRLLFVCNCVATAIFFCFAMLLTDQQFMDETIVDSMVSSNIYFPCVLMAGFVVLFLPFSYGVFFKARKRDYGIFLSLGMRKKEMSMYLAAESTIISASALGMAFVLGTALSMIFYGILHYVAAIGGIYWSFRLEAYLITGALYAVVVVFTVFFSILKILWEKIVEMIKAPFASEKKGALYAALEGMFPVYMNKRLIRHSFLVRHKGEWRFRTLLGGVLVASSLFFVTFSVSLVPVFFRDVDVYAPFDLSYATIWGYNQISVSEVVSCLEDRNVSVLETVQIPFIRDEAFNYISASEVNNKIGCEYEVAEGQFLNVFQYDMGDGYGHDVVSASSVVLRTAVGDRKLFSAGSDVRILWNKTPAMADRTLILNEHDFSGLRADYGYYNGILNLFQFSGWEKSKDGIQAVQELLTFENSLPEAKQWMVRVSAKALDYQRARQSGALLIVLMLFVSVLIAVAEYILIHFRVLAEKDENRRSIRCLWLLGMTEQEIYPSILSKNRMRFVTPVAVGIPLAAVIVYFCMSRAYHYGGRSVILCLGLGIVWFGAVYIAQVKYTKRELRSMG